MAREANPAICRRAVCAHLSGLLYRSGVPDSGLDLSAPERNTSRRIRAFQRIAERVSAPGLGATSRSDMELPGVVAVLRSVFLRRVSRNRIPALETGAQRGDV